MMGARPQHAAHDRTDEKGSRGWPETGNNGAHSQAPRSSLVCPYRVVTNRDLSGARPGPGESN